MQSITCIRAPTLTKSMCVAGGHLRYTQRSLAAANILHANDPFFRRNLTVPARLDLLKHKFCLCIFFVLFEGFKFYFSTNVSPCCILSVAERSFWVLRNPFLEGLLLLEFRFPPRCLGRRRSADALFWCKRRAGGPPANGRIQSTTGFAASELCEEPERPHESHPRNHL